MCPSLSLSGNRGFRTLRYSNRRPCFEDGATLQERGILQASEPHPRHGCSDKKLAKLILEETNTPETDSLTGISDSADPSGNDGPSGREARSASVSEGQEDVSPGPKPEKHRSWKKSFGKPS